MPHSGGSCTPLKGYGSGGGGGTTGGTGGSCGTGGMFTGGGGGSFGAGTGTAGGGAIAAGGGGDGGGAVSGSGAGNEPDGAVGRETALARSAATAWRSLARGARTAIARRSGCVVFPTWAWRIAAAAGLGATNAAGEASRGVLTALTPA